jgi:hypothetical protein
MFQEITFEPTKIVLKVGFRERDFEGNHMAQKKLLDKN